MFFHLRSILSLALLSFVLKGAITYEGDGTNATFSFSVGPIVSTSISNLKSVELYTGASQTGAKEYAISRAFSTGSKFEGIAIETTLVDGKTATSPLYNQKIDFISLSNLSPVVVVNGTKNIVAYKNLESSKEILTSANLNDANEQLTNAILGLQVVNGGIIAPVNSNAGGTFGASGSGLALVQQKDADKQPILQVLNADPSSATDTNRAAPLNNSSDVLKINNDVTINSNNIDIYWSTIMQRFYICFQLTSNVAAGSGARAVAVGYVNGSNKVILNPIAPDSVFVGNNQIVGTGDADATVSIVKVRTMYTSTKLTYLIVLGANGSTTSVQNLVYALPIVSLKSYQNSAIQGTLADVTQTPTDYYNDGIYFTGRAFTTAASDSSELFTTASTAAQVGAGALPIDPSNAVSDLMVSGDMVIATVNEAFSGSNSPGIYQSKAMYDDEGKIQAWTPWERIGATANSTGAAVLDIFNGNVVRWQTSTNANDTVSKTVWASNDLATQLETDFTLANGGLQGLNDFPKSTSGLSNLSLMIATGVRKLALIESGDLQGGFFKPVDNWSSHAESFNAVITSISAGTTYVTVNGGDLNGVGPIITSTIATNSGDNKSWIFIGGFNGVAVLMDSSGDGWTGTISNLSDIPNNSRFKLLGNFKNVVKVFGAGDYLYILTLRALYRAELDSTDFQSGTISTTLIATPKEMGLSSNASFTDIVVSESLALLATSQGLYRVGNGQDVRTATSTLQLNWTFINSPGSFGPVFKIYTLSNDTDQNKFTDNGQLYVLNSYVGYNNSSVSRFSVNLSGAIDDDTVTWIPDTFIKNKQSYFINFDAFRDTFTVLGTTQYGTHSKDVNKRNEDGTIAKPFAEILRPNITSGTILTFLKGTTLNLQVPADPSDPSEVNEQTPSILSSPILLRSANGGLVISANFGLRVNE